MASRGTDFSNLLALLAEPLREWVELKNWSGFWPIQRYAIRRFLAPDRSVEDTLLAAPTAGGKTMAAFLPLLTLLWKGKREPGASSGFEILYVIPTKALVSQQNHPKNDVRTSSDAVGRRCTPWMGDVDHRIKSDRWQSPAGILMITPESLEGRLIKRPYDLESRFRALKAVVIDELHAYFGNPRGTQLISQLTRLEAILERRVPRIALSATLGDGTREGYLRILRFLRPGSQPSDSALPALERAADEPHSHRAEIRFHVRLQDPDEPGQARAHIASDLREVFDEAHRGKKGRTTGEAKTGLIFTNSRREAEIYTHLLNTDDNAVVLPADWADRRHGAERDSADQSLPDESPRASGKSARTGRPAPVHSEWRPFHSDDPWRDTRRYWTHHGSLDRATRSQGELRMRTKEVACTLVATTTLELGIDIGTIEEVAQIGPGHSVASLRQRMGRSGRSRSEVDPQTGELKWTRPPRLHVFIREPEVDEKAPVLHRLRLPTFQALAQVYLLRNGVFEAPDLDELHLSTFVQQLLSLVHQRREQGVTRREAFEILATKGPFHGLERSLHEGSVRVFDVVVERLRTRIPPLLDLDLDEKAALSDDSELFLTSRGEQLVDSTSFWAAFRTPREYTLRSAAGNLGTAALGANYGTGDRILFNGRAWEITAIDHDRRVIDLRPAQAGSALYFSGDALIPSDDVVAAMQRLYELDGKAFTGAIDPLASFDPEARRMLEEGRATYGELTLRRTRHVRIGNDLFWFPWVGTKTLNGLAAVLRWARLPASAFRMSILIHDRRPEAVAEAIRSLLTNDLPDWDTLARRCGAATIGKFDHYLTPSLRRRGYASAWLGSKPIMLSKLKELQEALS